MTDFIIDITFVCAMSVVEVAFASSVVTGDFEDLESYFHVGEVVTALTVTLMVCGFGVGPLLWSPLVSISSYDEKSPSLIDVLFRAKLSVVAQFGSSLASSTSSSSSHAPSLRISRRC